jgi:aminoglycoside phosphotransferase (APT) family kinase protein
MSDPPWASDRGELDAERVASTVGAQFPELRPVRARFLGAGWDNDAWLVADTWVFRFPRRREVAASLEGERRLLDVVAAALDVAVPRIERLGRPDRWFPHAYAGYRHLAGEPADRCEIDAAAEAEIARALGSALARLHAVAPERVASLALPSEADRWEGRRRAILACAETFRGAMPADVLRPLEAFLRGEIAPPPYGGPLRLVHNDLAAEHVLLDPQSHRVRAILDWADAAIGDPAIDFAGLWAWRGERFARRALAHYALPWDEAFLARCRLTAWALGVGYVAHEARVGDAEALARARASFLRSVA